MRFPFLPSLFLELFKFWISLCAVARMLAYQLIKLEDKPMEGLRTALCWFMLVVLISWVAGCSQRLGTNGLPEKPPAPQFQSHTGESVFSSESGDDVEISFSWTVPTGGGPDRRTPERNRNMSCV